MSSLAPDTQHPTRLKCRSGRYGFAALVVFIAALVALLRPTDLNAIDVIQLSLEDFQGAGLRSDRLSLSLEWQGASAALIQFQLDKPRFTDPDLPVPDWLRELKQVRLDCPKAQLDRERIRCMQGRIHLPLPWLDKPLFRVDLDYAFNSGKLKLDLQGLALAGGEGALSLSADTKSKTQGWQVQYRLTGAQVAQLPQLIGHFAKLRMPLALTGGHLNVKGRIRGSQLLGSARVKSLGYELELDDLAGGNDEGSLAMDGMAVTLSGELHPDRRDQAFDVAAHFQAGELYAEPLYLDFAQGDLHLSAKGRSVGSKGLVIDAFELHDPGAVTTRGSLSLLSNGGLGGLGDLSLTALNINLDRFYPRYLQPLLAESNLEDLEVGGQLAGGLTIRNGQLHELEFELQRINLDDHKQRFGLYEAQGNLRWHASEPRESSLKALGGYLLAMDVGGFEWHGHSSGEHFYLDTPAQLPLLDGSLQIDAFQFRGGDTPEAAFEAVMTPISMQRLAHAFSWPSMEGQLSGVIPRITLKGGRLEMDGTLLVRAFDGQLTLRNLMIEDPLGVAPRMDVDILLKDLDLKALTRTFAFGRIEGRLEGQIDHLTLVNWQPVSFDARFATPEKDDSRHRISQRAVDNLTSLGGGIGGGLSQTFLRFFEEFSYQRLGLSCRLRGSVCEMGGVGQAEHGYYIVKGSGLPQINVIGYSRRVDWPTMVGRLKRITEKGGPVIQ